MDRWQRSSSRVTEIEFGWWRCNQALSLRTGGSQYRDDQFPRKTGEIDSARSHMNVSAIFPFTSAIIRRASHTPPLLSRSIQIQRPLFSSLPSAPVPLCIDNASVHRSGKSFSSLLRSFHFSFSTSRSRASDGKWFSFFLLFDDLFLPC